MVRSVDEFMETAKTSTELNKHKFDRSMIEVLEESFLPPSKKKFCIAVCTAAISRAKQVASSHFCLFEPRID